MSKSFFLVTALASILTCAAATVALAQSDPAALLKQHVEAIARGDAAGALALYADGGERHNRCARANGKLGT